MDLSLKKFYVFVAESSLKAMELDYADMSFRDGTMFILYHADDRRCFLFVENSGRCIFSSVLMDKSEKGAKRKMSSVIDKMNVSKGRFNLRECEKGALILEYVFLIPTNNYSTVVNDAYEAFKAVEEYFFCYI